MWNDHRTCSRGILCSRVEEKWADIRKLAEKRELSELQKFIKNLKDSDDFGGVIYRNRFSVSETIGLVGLGFFGPHSKKTALYKVYVAVELNGKVLCTKELNVHATLGETFHVYFDKVMILEPKTWYTIGFQLDGPRTGILDPNAVISEWKDEGIVMGKRKSVEFSFLRGSLQMPEIIYIFL